MKVALVHELLTMKGGAEKVLRILAGMFPDAPIYTLLYDEKKLGAWFPPSRVRTSTLQRRATVSKNHHFYLSRFPAAAEAWDFSGYDLVLSSSSAFAHGIITNGKPKHLCYVHSPARYLWDRTHDVLRYAGKGILGPLKRRYLERTFHHLRIWDSEAANRPDMLLAASKEVQRRIQLYWRRDSTVLYPPIDDSWLAKAGSDERVAGSNAPRATRYALPATRYFLIVSTLTPYKRIDLAIHACNQAKVKLIIAGDGPDRRRLEKIAGSTITFLGFQTEESLRSLYSNADATLFPGDEDFGLVPLESMACGTPVIAYRSGGALETVMEGTTGSFFEEPTPSSLAHALNQFRTEDFDPIILQKHVATFSRENFQSGIHAAIDHLMKKA